jgi:hypothetical protein
LNFKKWINFPLFCNNEIFHFLKYQEKKMKVEELKEEIKEFEDKIRFKDRTIKKV